MSPRSRNEWQRGGTKPRPRLEFGRAADPHGAALSRTESCLAGGQHPRRRWRVCRALDRAPLRHEDRRVGISSRTAAWLRSAMGCPAGSGPRSRRPKTPVVAITGDGGFNMMLGELETARRAGIGLTIVVVNNAASGYVKALQHAMFRGRYQSSDLVEMDYAAIARAMGCNGHSRRGPGQARRCAAQAALAERDPPDGARRHCHARPRTHAPRRRQPHGRRSSRATGSRDSGGCHPVYAGPS